MQTRTIFLWAGAVWGLALGVLAAAMAAAAAFVLLWAVVFGDHPWPRAAPWVVAGVSVLAGALAFGRAMIAARVCAEERGGSRMIQARRSALAWLALGIGFCGVLVLGTALWHTAERANAERAREAEAGSAEMVASLHAPTQATLEVNPARVTVAFECEGRRAGLYRLNVRLLAPIADRVLAERSQNIRLDAGPCRQTEVFETAAVLQAYRRQLMGGGLGSVDQRLVAEVKLEPVLGASEQALIPASRPMPSTVRAAARLAFVAAPQGNRLVP